MCAAGGNFCTKSVAVLYHRYGEDDQSVRALFPRIGTGPWWDY